MEETKEQKEAKLKQQTTQIFNIAEKPVMEFITAFLREDPAVIFKDDIPAESDPLILLPINEYKKNIYLKFTLKPITNKMASEGDRIKNINDIIEYEHIKESIGFLLYCVKSVYPSIVASNMINNKPMVNIDLELNESHWVFYPKFNHELTIKKKFLDESLSRIRYIKKQKEEPVPADMVKELDKEFGNIIIEVGKVNNELTSEIVENEKKINDSFVDKPILGIFVEEIKKSQLPKPKYGAEQPKLPVISSQSYEDPI